MRTYITYRKRITRFEVEPRVCGILRDLLASRERERFSLHLYADPSKG